MSAEEDLNQERRITFCLYEYWEKLAGESNLPALKNMNRDEIAPFKKNLVLIDLRNGHDQPTFQVIGQDLQEDLESDLTSMPVSHVPRRTMLSRVTDHYLEVLANRVPIAFEAEFVNRDSEKALYRGILLPFSDDNQNINFILGGVRWILESEVSLDDSKPTIEELMKTISAGREDQPFEMEDEQIAAEYTDEEAAEPSAADEVASTGDNFSMDDKSADIYSEEEMPSSGEEVISFDEAETEHLPIEDEFESGELEQETQITDASVEEDILDLTDEADLEEIELTEEPTQNQYTSETTFDIPSENQIGEVESPVVDDNEIVDEDAISTDNIQESPEEEVLAPIEEPVLEELELTEDLLDEDEDLSEHSDEFNTPVMESDEFETVEETGINETEAPLIAEVHQTNDGPGLVRKTFIPEEEAVETTETIVDKPDLIEEPDAENEIEAIDLHNDDELDVEIDDYSTLDEEQSEEALLSSEEPQVEPASEMSFKDIVEEQLAENDPPLSMEQDELLVSGEAEIDILDDQDKPATIEELLRGADDDLELVDENITPYVPVSEEEENPVSSTETLLETLEVEAEVEALEETYNIEPTEVNEQDITVETPEMSESFDANDETLEPIAAEEVPADIVTTVQVVEEVQEEAFEIDDTPDDDLSIEDLMQSIIAERKFDHAYESDSKHNEDDPHETHEEEPLAAKIVDETPLDEPEVVEEEPALDNMFIKTEILEDEEAKTDENSVADSDDATEEVSAQESLDVDALIAEEPSDVLQPSEGLILEEAEDDRFEEHVHEVPDELVAEETTDEMLVEDTGAKTENTVETSVKIELYDEPIPLDEVLISVDAPTPFNSLDEELAIDDANSAEETKNEILEDEVSFEEVVLDEPAEEVESVDLEEQNLDEEMTVNDITGAENEDDALTFEEEINLIDETEVEFSTDENTVQDIIELEEPVINEPQSIEPDNVTKVPTAEINETPVKKRRRGSVIERAMEMMVPSFGVKSPIKEDALVVGTTEIVEDPEDTDNSQQAPIEAAISKEPLIETSAELEEPLEVSVSDDPISNEIIEELIEDDIVHPVDELVEEILSEQSPMSQEHQDVHEDDLIEDENIEKDTLEEDALEVVHTEESVAGESGIDEAHTLPELRTTLKQIVGYIKKEDANHNRSRDSLYNILTAIYEFHNTCEKSPTAYNELVNENDLKIQSRAPFTPVLKICLGKDYDKTRLTEYAAALGIARYMNVEVSEFHAFIKNFPGGIKGCVKEMRIIRKHGASGNITARKTRSVEEAREILRDMAPIASFRLKKVIVGNNVDEFCLLLAKRDGHDISVLKILDDKYTKLDPILKRAAFIKGNLNDRK